jgi:hypothetical protein
MSDTMGQIALIQQKPNSNRSAALWGWMTKASFCVLKVQRKKWRRLPPTSSDLQATPARPKPVNYRFAFFTAAFPRKMLLPFAMPCECQPAC